MERDRLAALEALAAQHSRRVEDAASALERRWLLIEQGLVPFLEVEDLRRDHSLFVLGYTAGLMSGMQIGGTDLLASVSFVMDVVRAAGVNEELRRMVEEGSDP